MAQLITIFRWQNNIIDGVVPNQFIQFPNGSGAKDKLETILEAFYDPKKITISKYSEVKIATLVLKHEKKVKNRYKQIITRHEKK